jgi:hypothetical protein
MLQSASNSPARLQLCAKQAGCGPMDRAFATRRKLVRVSARIFLLAAGAVLPALPALAQPAPAADYRAAPQAAAAWPHTISRDGATVTVYQPQAISWPGRKTLTARAAIAISRPGQGKPLLGTIELTLATRVDEAAGIVYLSNPVLLATHFPSLDTGEATRLETKVRATLPQIDARPVPLASVLLSLKQLPVTSVAVRNDAPAIFYSDRPASLVVFDGSPVLIPAGTSGLTYAVNTNWDVFVDHDTWYLLNNGFWFSAPQASGPYTPVARLPAAFSTLPKGETFSRVSLYVPAKAPTPKERVPKIFVSTKPAEVIVTDGAPSFKPVAGTGLQRVLNTASVLFFDPANGLFYLQLSGRWFSANGFNGAWEFATDKLPADFSLIAPHSSDAAILASVPGTVAAQEAVLKAQIPTTATLQRSAVKFTVVYSGAPRFVVLPGTTLLYAANTSSYVLKIGPDYYACEGGAWFVAAAATGPWLLADSIPAVIHTIPPASPLYPVTYVQVYAVTPTAVTFGYTAGYTLGYVSYGVLVFGTGYYYPPVIIPGVVPIYYPYPYTYAGGVWYNTSTGAWARGGTVYGPYGGAVTAGSYYNPSTGAWAHGAAVYGPNGGAGAWSAYNPSTGSYAHGSSSWSNGSGSANASYYNARSGVSGSTTQNANPYSRWGSSTFSGANQTVNTQSGANANGRAGGFNSSTGAKGAGYENNINGGSGGVVKTQNGDVYAGHDGNIYQHTDSGWSKYDNGAWNPVQTPTNKPASATAPTNRAPGGTPGDTQGARGNPAGGATDRGNYQQLEQDRLGRQAGSGRWGASRGAGADGSRSRKR